MKLKKGQSAYIGGKRFEGEIPDKYLSERQKERLGGGSKSKPKSKAKPPTEPKEEPREEPKEG